MLKIYSPKSNPSLDQKFKSNPPSDSVLDVATSPINRAEIIRELNTSNKENHKPNDCAKTTLSKTSDQSIELPVTPEELHNKYLERRSLGLTGNPPELRDNFKIKQIIENLSPYESKNWNDKDIVTITRGVIFGLRACGVDQSKMEEVTKFALGAIHEDSVISRFMGPIKAAWNQVESAPLGTKLLSPLIMGGAVVMSVAGSIRGFFDKNYEQSDLLGNSVGYYGTPAGASIMIKAKHPADLGFIVAHEVCHMMQNGKEPHPEYFTHVTHSAFLDAYTGPKGAALWSWDDHLTAINGQFTDYERFFPQSAAASSIFRTTQMLDGNEAAMKILQELRDVSKPSELKDVYVKFRKKSL